MFRTSKPTEQDIRIALKGVAQGEVTIVLQDAHALVTLEVDPKRGTELEAMRQEVERTVQHLKGIKTARVILTAQKQPAAPQAPIPTRKALLPNVKHVIAVASGKGGVGKSTVAANLAVALAQRGLRTGLLDADIYGPSLPMLMGVRGDKPKQNDDAVIPVEKHGVKIMSMGFMVAEETAMIWRGPMVQSALLQMLRDVQWGDLDVLVIDMPPGTGDTQLTIAQRVPLSGAVIVSTPQDIALLDAVKAVQMFQKLSVPILGLVENMSFFCCPHCGNETPVFGHNGAKNRAVELGLPFLGAIPLEAEIREFSDKGEPIAGNVARHTAPVFAKIAASVAANLGKDVKPAPKIIFES